MLAAHIVLLHANAPTADLCGTPGDAVHSAGFFHILAGCGYVTSW